MGLQWGGYCVSYLPISFTVHVCTLKKKEIKQQRNGNQKLAAVQLPFKLQISTSPVPLFEL